MSADVGDEVFEVGAGECPVGRDRRLVVLACERVETIYDRLEAGNSFGVRNLRWITEKMSSIWFSHDAAQHRNLSGQRPVAGDEPGRRAVVCEGALWLISGVAVQPIAQPDGHWLGKAPPSRRRRSMR